MGLRSQDFGPTSAALQGHKQGAGHEVEHPEYEPVPIRFSHQTLSDYLITSSVSSKALKKDLRLARLIVLPIGLFNRS